MPTASKSSAVAARKVAQVIAEMQPECLHPDFMFEVNAYLEKRHLRLEVDVDPDLCVESRRIQIVKVQS